MIRMLGVISGAAIAIVLLTWFVGVPQFTSERPAVEPPPQVVDLVELPAEPELAEPPAEAVVIEEPDETVVELPALAAAEEDIIVPLATDDGTQPAPINDMFAAAAEPQWFAFWSPFRSEIAAQGFVRQLQSVTGLDYRVVKVKAGVYEVAFAYSDNDEIDLNLSTISAATGLDLPGNP